MNDHYHELTKGYLEGIHRHIRVGGGIGANQANTLLRHLDSLNALLEEVVENGDSWGDNEWSVFIDAAIPLIDLWTVRTGRKVNRR